LTAYFSSSGYVSSVVGQQCINIYNVSTQLQHDISILLNYMGIFTVFGKHHVEIFKQKYYIIYIPLEYADILIDTIDNLTFYTELKEIKDWIFHTNIQIYTDKIPNISGLITDIAQDLELKSNLFFTKKSNLTRNVIYKYLDMFEDENNNDTDNPDFYTIYKKIDLLKQAAYSEIIWDEIVNIEIIDLKENKFVYDLSVTGNGSFMIDDGILIVN
jgi:hypothetical protein